MRKSYWGLVALVVVLGVQPGKCAGQTIELSSGRGQVRVFSSMLPGMGGVDGWARGTTLLRG